jgi:hypothetical protein
VVLLVSCNKIASSLTLVTAVPTVFGSRLAPRRVCGGAAVVRNGELYVLETPSTRGMLTSYHGGGGALR